MQIDPLQLVSRIAALEREVERLRAVEGPLPHIGFSAAFDGDQSNIATGAYAVCEYDTAVWNYGSGFDTATNTFTAPVDGFYFMGPRVELADVDSAATHIRFRLVTTRRSFIAHMPPDGFDQDCDYVTMQLAVICRLTAGQTAYCDIRIDGGAAQTDIVQGTGTRWTCWLVG